MVKGVASLAALSVSLGAWGAGNISFEGNRLPVIEVKPEASTGLNVIYVVDDMEGCRILYQGVNCDKVNVLEYSNLGGGFAQEVKDITRTPTSITLNSPSGDRGYIIEDNAGSNFYFWVTDYSKHRFSIENISVSNSNDCDFSILDFEGNGTPITYYTINGQPKTLNREIIVEYTTQEFDKDANAYQNVDIKKEFESLGSKISLTPPAYCSTYYTVSGDRFQKQWGEGVTWETSVAQPVAVDCRTEAIQTENSGDEPSNVIKGSDSGLGGSAPAEINFYAYTTEGVIDNEWQMSRDINFDNPEYRFKEKDLTYTFTEEGTFYLRYIGSNFEGNCETYGDIYTVSIGASDLICPNAFSPNDDGVNDVWKVSYRSLIEFHCEIFNRNGQKIIGFDDPDQGWDGTWHGKKVKPGVYYYVITATGADGRKYKKSGDINIIKFTNNYNGTNGGNDYLE